MSKPEGFDPSSFAERGDIDGAWGDLPEDHLDEVDAEVKELEEIEEEIEDFKMAA